MGSPAASNAGTSGMPDEAEPIIMHMTVSSDMLVPRRGNHVCTGEWTLCIGESGLDALDQGSTHRT